MVNDFYIIRRENGKLSEKQVFIKYTTYSRFKSLIHKIFKEEDDDDIEELAAIR